MRKRYVVMALVLIAGMAPALVAQIPNPGFETWVLGNPTGWATNNIQGVAVPVSQSTTAHTGSSSLRGQVVTFSGFGTYPPYIASYFGYNGRPARLTGWYQFTGVSSDSFTVVVALYTGAGQPVAAGIFFSGVNRTAWTEFTVPLDYADAGIPDSAYIWVTALPGQDDTMHVGTSLLLDDLAFAGTASAVDEQHSLPESFVLHQNYPNPFNPSTTIRFSLPEKSTVALTVHNALGEEVATILKGEREAGTHDIRFDASGLSSGVYLCRLQSAGTVRTIKLLLLR